VALAGAASVEHRPAHLAIGLGALGAGTLVALRGPAVGLLAVSTFGILALIVLSQRLIRWPDDRRAQVFVLRWAIASFAIHLVVGMAIISSRTAVNYLGPDAHTYQIQAARIAAHWSRGYPMPFLPGGKEGYYYVLGAIYWVFGRSPWGGVALNAVMAGALVPILSDSTCRLFGRAAARYVPMILLLVPGMIVWPSQLLKEAPFVFLTAVAANCAVRLVDRYSLRPLLVLAVVLPALLWFRAQLGFAVLAGVMVGIVLGRRQLAIGIAGGLLAAALIAGAVAAGVGSSGYQAAVSTDLQQANDVRRGLAVGARSGFSGDADISTSNRALSYLPRGLLVVLLGPFPWQLHGARQLVVIPDITAWWVLLLGLWWGQRAARRRGRSWLVLVAPAAATAAVLALVLGNYGILVRERVQILVLLAPVMAVGFEQRQRARSAQADAVVVA